MTYDALKSIDLTNFVNVVMCFRVSCSNAGGQVSPVRTIAFRRILLSFSRCVQFKIKWLIVCSSFSLQVLPLATKQSGGKLLLGSPGGSVSRGSIAQNTGNEIRHMER
jgi:hypothetical protein